MYKTVDLVCMVSNILSGSGILLTLWNSDTSLMMLLTSFFWLTVSILASPWWGTSSLTSLVPSRSILSSSNLYNLYSTFFTYSDADFAYASAMRLLLECRKGLTHEDCGSKAFPLSETTLSRGTALCQDSRLIITALVDCGLLFPRNQLLCIPTWQDLNHLPNGNVHEELALVPWLLGGSSQVHSSCHFQRLCLIHICFLG